MAARFPAGEAQPACRNFAPSKTTMLLLLQLSHSHASSSWASDAVGRAASLRTELPALRVQTLCDRPSILHVCGLFSDAECDEMIEQARSSGLMRASRVGTADGSGYKENSAIRSSHECVLAPGACAGCVRTLRLLDALQVVARVLPLPLGGRLYEVDLVQVLLDVAEL